ncbi:hypothetical protein KAI56_01595 [Candidatus Parcubacteria bacterium]|nr:hypothetical protein [Candidatus Parcubacteria bacterium]
MNRDKAILLIFLLVGILTMFSIPLWFSAILIVIVAVIFLIAPTILKVSETSSIASKIPSTKTILPGLFWLAAIIFVLLLGLECITYIDGLSPENFSSDTTKKDYGYEGKFVIQDESLKTCGNVTVFNSDASDEFWGIPLYWEHPSFYIFGTGKGTIKVVLDNGQEKYEKEARHIDGSFKIKFGTVSNYGRKDIVYFIKNDISLTDDKPPIYFDTDRPYSVKVYFNGTYSVFKINAGE